jgi:hypothetical protein
VLRAQATSADSITLSDGLGLGRTLTEPPIWSATPDPGWLSSLRPNGSLCVPDVNRQKSVGTLSGRADRAIRTPPGTLARLSDTRPVCHQVPSRLCRLCPLALVLWG